MTRKLFAEFFGIFWLVFGGCGSAVLAAAFPELGSGFAGVSLAFGLTVLTAFFLIVILGSTSDKVPGGFAPISIGLALTLIHLISIPVINSSVNPARSTGVAFYAETAAVPQLWLFWVAPILGAGLGAFVWRFLLSPDESLRGIGGDGG